MGKFCEWVLFGVVFFKEGKKSKKPTGSVRSS